MRKLLTSLAVLAAVASCNKPSAPDNPPQPTPPGSTVSLAANVSTNRDTAVLTGTVTADASVQEVGVCYGLQPDPDISAQKVTIAARAGAFQCTITGLRSDRNYYARAYWRTGSAVQYGSSTSFQSRRFSVELGNFWFNNRILRLGADNNGNVYAAGYFTGAAGYPVAHWNGSTWTELPGRSSDWIGAMSVQPNGNVYIGERDNMSWSMYRWSGSAWSGIGLYNDNNFRILDCAADQNGNVYAVGLWANASGKYFLARWNGSTYTMLGNFDDYPSVLTVDAAGNVYMAGLLNHGNNQGHFYIAKWNGTAWSELGDFNDIITALAVDPAGNLLVTGAFTNAAGKYHVARWNGTSWAQVGDPNLGATYAVIDYSSVLTTDPQGNIYIAPNRTNAAGNHYILKWDGTAWTEFASFPGQIIAVCSDGAGTIYAAGNFQNSQGSRYVARCN